MDRDRLVATKSASETRTLAAEFSVSLKRKTDIQGPTVICLYGPLGSGKTTFVQGFARGLGITQRILSPTFITVRRYGIPGSSGRFYHLDLYRVGEAYVQSDPEITEILGEPDAFIAVEWAEKLGSALPVKRHDIRFAIGGDRHSIKFTGEVHG